MKLEELIYRQFVCSGELTRHLATFAKLPAVFSPEAPDDGQEGWGGQTQYPQIVFNFDMQANEERKSVGTLSVDLLCQNTADVSPETIEPEVRSCLRDVLLKPEGDSLYAFTWARTDSFSMQEKKHDLVIGSEIRFDIHEYVHQVTTDPDPIAAVDQYIKKLYPDCVVAGLDRMGDVTRASVAAPVVYNALTSVERGRETNTVVWMDGKIAVHILCPDSSVRMKMAADLANQMSLDGEIILLDHSPMTIRRLQVDHQSDYLKDGQIFMTVNYGLLRYRAKPHEMQGTGFNYG